MEELRSTEILDREIHDDARKKSERILRDSDAECERILSAVKDRIETSCSEIKTAYEKKAAVFKKNESASLPLEKTRFKASFVNSAVNSALGSYFSELPHEKKIFLICWMLKKYEPVLKLAALQNRKSSAAALNGEAGSEPRGHKKSAAADSECLLIDCTAAGLSAREAEQCVSSVFDSCRIAACGEQTVSDIFDTGIYISVCGGAVRCKAAFRQLADYLLDTYRYELADALFGGRIPE
ncbi:MAG: hypothetical protein NC041_06655 [Bacteroides sp.]|nr:hypothetical protein [Prevotella sp.]MCM1406976.1 hypothetical protein [Treponema brennaborense]MCM1470127.1 hypothetical protein [Bacteroides sp.]